MQHIPIYNLDSDANLLDELSLGIRERSIDQKFAYTWDGAKLYYEGILSNPIYKGNEFDRSHFAHLINKFGTKKAIISLWCWNSKIEKDLFENYFDKNNTDYYGVDSSYDMLLLSSQLLSNTDFNSRLICADFWKMAFRNELNLLTREYDDRIFMFFSNTFWNISHTNIIDILRNLLKEGEKIWLDVRIRKGTKLEDDLEISEIISENMKKEHTIKSHLKILTDIWLEKEDWDFSITTTKESFINALKFEYHFNVKKKKETNIKSDNMVILPWEKIKIYQIYSYDPDGFINFFNEHGFSLLDKQIKGYRGQFLFEKK